MIGCLASLHLVTPLSGRPARQNVLALILVAIGILLFFLTWVINRQLGIRGAGITDPTIWVPRRISRVAFGSPSARAGPAAVRLPVG